MPFAKVQGLNIYYEEQGRGLPLVFLHGATSCAANWFQQVQAFAEHYHVIAYDSWGHGKSENPPFDAPDPDRAEELLGFLDQLSIDRAILVGNSMGSMTSMTFALRHPERVRALVLAGMGVGSGVGLPSAPRQPLVLPRLDPSVTVYPTSAFTDKFVSEHPDLAERYARARSTPTLLERLRNPRTGGFVRTDDWGSVETRIWTITAPTLVITGSEDQFFRPAQNLHFFVGGSKLYILRGGGHLAYYEMPEEFNRVVLKYLEASL